MTVEELRAQSKKLFDDAEGIVASAQTKERAPTADENTRIDDLCQQAQALDRQADTAQAEYEEQRRQRELLHSHIEPSSYRLAGLGGDAQNRISFMRDRELQDDPRQGFESLGDFACSVASSSIPGHRAGEVARHL